MPLDDEDIDRVENSTNIFSKNGLEGTVQIVSSDIYGGPEQGFFIDESMSREDDDIEVSTFSDASTTVSSGDFLEIVQGGAICHDGICDFEKFSNRPPHSSDQTIIDEPVYNYRAKPLNNMLILQIGTKYYPLYGDKALAKSGGVRKITIDDGIEVPLENLDNIGLEYKDSFLTSRSCRECTVSEEMPLYGEEILRMYKYYNIKYLEQEKFYVSKIKGVLSNIGTNNTLRLIQPFSVDNVGGKYATLKVRKRKLTPKLQCGLVNPDTDRVENWRTVNLSENGLGTINLTGKGFLAFRAIHTVPNSYGNIKIKYKVQEAVSSLVESERGIFREPIYDIKVRLFGSNGEGGIIQNSFNNFINDTRVIGIIRAILVFYICYTALMLLIGETSFTPGECVNRILRFSVVVAVLSPGGWELLDTYIFDLIITGAMELISNYFPDVLIPGVIYDTPEEKVISTFEAMFTYLLDLRYLYNIGMIALQNPIIAFIAIFSLIVVLHSIFKMILLYVVSIFSLGFLMMLSPIFIPFYLFEYTKKMASTWLSMLFSLALQPLLLFIAGGLILNMVWIVFTSILAFDVQNRCYFAFCLLQLPEAVSQYNTPVSFAGINNFTVSLTIVVALVAYIADSFPNLMTQIGMSIATGGFVGVGLQTGRFFSTVQNIRGRINQISQVRGQIRQGEQFAATVARMNPDTRTGSFRDKVASTLPGVGIGADTAGALLLKRSALSSKLAELSEKGVASTDIRAKKLNKKIQKLDKKLDSRGVALKQKREKLEDKKAVLKAGGVADDDPRMQKLDKKIGKVALEESLAAQRERSYADMSKGELRELYTSGLDKGIIRKELLERRKEAVSQFDQASHDAEDTFKKQEKFLSQERRRVISDTKLADDAREEQLHSIEERESSLDERQRSYFEEKKRLEKEFRDTDPLRSESDTETGWDERVKGVSRATDQAFETTQGMDDK